MQQTVMRETTVATRVGPLRVRQAGGGGPTVLLVHGLLLDGRLWDGGGGALRARWGRLRVRRAGGGGPTVLLVHGLLLDGRLWDGVVDALPRDVRVVVPDLPLGARRRPGPDRSVLTPEHVAGALLDVLDGVDAATAALGGQHTRGGAEGG